MNSVLNWLKSTEEQKSAINVRTGDTKSPGPGVTGGASMEGENPSKKTAGDALASIK